MIGVTTLTLQALVLVAFIYEYASLVWRELSVKLCDESNRIAHSTLYRAVHGLGQLFKDSKEAHRWVEHHFLISDYPWPPLKSKYAHTQKRETGVRQMLNLLFCILSISSGFIQAFFRYLKNLHIFFNHLGKPLVRLYIKKKAGINLNTS